ncbi:MAG: hypothetical protein K6C10_12050 [Prevotella sp.]|nr:hypothetical protein [Prevotella sp.]
MELDLYRKRTYGQTSRRSTLTKSLCKMLVLVMLIPLCQSCKLIAEGMEEDAIRQAVSPSGKAMTEAAHKTSKKQQKQIQEQRQKLMAEGKCPDCMGMGKTPNGHNNCATCNGTGKYVPNN